MRMVNGECCILEIYDVPWEPQVACFRVDRQDGLWLASFISAVWANETKRRLKTRRCISEDRNAQGAHAEGMRRAALSRAVHRQVKVRLQQCPCGAVKLLNSHPCGSKFRPVRVSHRNPDDGESESNPIACENPNGYAVRNTAQNGSCGILPLC
ncbi:hypothetical protein BD413DRAFT_533290 [Trametes elegans]|nr:hypothetical protein BD413DRAFT_533290 [Trametes elegans]